MSCCVSIGTSSFSTWEVKGNNLYFFDSSGNNVRTFDLTQTVIWEQGTGSNSGFVIKDTVNQEVFILDSNSITEVTTGVTLTYDILVKELETVSLAPVRDMFSITPNDGADLSENTRGLYIGTAGDVRVDTIDGTDITIPNLNAGQTYPFRVSKVYSTGTSASNIIGLL